MLLFERQVVDVHSSPSSSDTTSLSKQRKAVTRDIRQRRSESRQSCSKRFPLSRQFIFLLRCQWKLKKIRTVENSALATNVFAFRCEKRKLFMSRCLVQESKSLRKRTKLSFQYQFLAEANNSISLILLRIGSPQKGNLHNYLTRWRDTHGLCFILCAAQT